MKILIIDDDLVIRQVTRASLTRVGRMDVTEAADGQEGLAKASSEQPDAILLDVMMPGMNGPEVLAALQADPRSAAIPVIFLTAKAMPSETARWKSLGATAVLTKPFDPMTLPAEIRQALGRTD